MNYLGISDNIVNNSWFLIILQTVSIPWFVNCWCHTSQQYVCKAIFLCLIQKVSHQDGP